MRSRWYDRSPRTLPPRRRHRDTAPSPPPCLDNLLVTYCCSFAAGNVHSQRCTLTTRSTASRFARWPERDWRRACQRDFVRHTNSCRNPAPSPSEWSDCPPWSSSPPTSAQSFDCSSAKSAQLADCRSATCTWSPANFPALFLRLAATWWNSSRDLQNKSCRWMKHFSLESPTCVLVFLWVDLRASTIVAGRLLTSPPELRAMHSHVNGVTKNCSK